MIKLSKHILTLSINQLKNIINSDKIFEFFHKTLLKHLKLNITSKEKDVLLNNFLVLLNDIENDDIIKERLTYLTYYIKEL